MYSLTFVNIITKYSVGKKSDQERDLKIISQMMVLVCQIRMVIITVSYIHQ